MTRKILAAMLLVLVLSSVSYAAESEDMNMYVRKDVYDANMEALFNKLMVEISSLKTEMKEEIGSIRGEIKELSGRIEGRIDGLSGRIDGLSGKMDGLETRMSGLETTVYWILGLLGIVVGAIALTPLLKEIRKPSFTLDDVKRLIEENNAKLQANYMNMAR